MGARDDDEALRVLGVRAWRGIELLHGQRVKRAVPRHWHDALQVCAIEAGSGELHCGPRRHPTPKGTLFVVPPGEVHANVTADPEGCSYRTLMVPSSVLAFFLGERRAVRLQARGPFLVGEHRALRFLGMHRDLEGAAADLCTDLLLQHVLGLLCDETEATRPSLCQMPRTGTKRVRDYIEAHFNDNVRLRDLATLSGISPYHLSRVFQQRYGLPPHAYQTQIRLNRARRLLANGDPPARVAADTGFADQSHLGRVFKRFVGLSPAAYARQHQVRTVDKARS